MKDFIDQPAFIIYKISIEEQKSINNQLKSQRLRLSHASLLKYIQQHPGCAPKEVAQQLKYQPASLTNMLKHLVELGMIKREVNPNDPRRRHLYLLAKGTQALAAVNHAFAQMDKLIGPLQPDSLQQLNCALQQLTVANRH